MPPVTETCELTGKYYGRAVVYVSDSTFRKQLVILISAPIVLIGRCLFWSWFATTFSNYKSESPSHNRQRHDILDWAHRLCNAILPQDVLYSVKVVQLLQWKNINSLALTVATTISLSTYSYSPWRSAVHSWHDGTLEFVKTHSWKKGNYCADWNKNRLRVLREKGGARQVNYHFIVKYRPRGCFIYKMCLVVDFQFFCFFLFRNNWNGNSKSSRWHDCIFNAKLHTWKHILIANTTSLTISLFSLFIFSNFSSSSCLLLLSSSSFLSLKHRGGKSTHMAMVLKWALEYWQVFLTTTTILLPLLLLLLLIGLRLLWLLLLLKPTK